MSVDENLEQGQQDLVDYYRFWYAAYAYRGLSCNMPCEDGDDIHCYDFKEYIDSIKKEALSLLDTVDDANFILKSVYDEGDILHIVKKIATPGMFSDSLNMESGDDISCMRQDIPSNPEEDDVSECDEYGIPHPRLSDYVRLCGPAIFKIDVSIPIESLIFYFKKLQNTRFRSRGQFLSVPHFLDEADLEYNIAYYILKRVRHIRFSTNAAYPRAIGLWLWDQVYLKEEFPSVLRAVRALRRQSQEYGLPHDLVEQLGYSEASDSQLSRMCTATQRCIEKREVLKIA